MKYQVTVDEDLKELAIEYIEKRRSEMTTWESLLAEKNFPNLSSLGHKMKGVGESYGFSDLTRLGAELETAAKACDLAKVTQTVTAIKDYVLNVEIKFEAA